MFEMITKGFLIGLLVSAPMGPINMLVIQRTLHRGWLHGFATGLGAVLSDMIYVWITLVGLSFVDTFFDKNEQIIQTVGSVFIIIFGFLVFRSNPLRDWNPNRLAEETRYIRDFLSSFLLTFSNVAIILVLMGLYAHFSFNPLSEGREMFAIGFTSFVVAALLWWFILTALVSKLRKYINRKGLVLLNRGVGTILMLSGTAEIVWSFIQKLAD